MAARPLGRLFRQLGQAAPLQSEAPPDERLLACFAGSRDEGAFEEIVRRHGPMVLGVCRRLLRHEQDAEDAFQATFLVLARRAASLRRQGALGNWLYGVARRTALAALRAAARRRAREARVARPDAQYPGEREDIPSALDGELTALPGKYRAVLVLLDLEGRTRREAAGELGVPEGTVASRLARARGMLARRLVRRGIVPAAGPLAALLTESLAPAAVSEPVVLSTVKAAGLYAAGQTVPPRAGHAGVAALAEGVMRNMMMKELTKAAAVLVLMGLLALGCIVLAGGPPDGGGRVKESGRLAPGPKKGDRIRPGDRLLIQATGTLPESPINGVFRVEPGGTVALGLHYGRVVVEGRTPWEAEVAIERHLRKVLRKTAVQVTRYDPVPGEGIEALERRVRLLEEEVRALRATVERLGKRQGN